MQTERPLLREALKTGIPGLTAAERRIAQVALGKRPYAALLPIWGLARRAGVSAPSVTRFVAMLGCQGFLYFQRGLIDEKESALLAVELKRREVGAAAGDFLPGYAARAAQLLGRLVEGVSLPQFDALCALLADRRFGSHLIGGRTTNSIAHLIAAHLSIRGGDDRSLAVAGPAARSDDVSVADRCWHRLGHAYGVRLADRGDRHPRLRVRLAKRQRRIAEIDRLRL